MMGLSGQRTCGPFVFGHCFFGALFSGHCFLLALFLRGTFTLPYTSNAGGKPNTMVMESGAPDYSQTSYEEVCKALNIQP